MTDILTRLREAPEGSRELDRLVYAELVRLVPDYRGPTLDNPQHYTTSLSAAASLYPELPEMIPSDPLQACIEALKARMAKEDDGGSTRAEVAEAVGFDDPYDHGQCNRADDPA